MRNENVPQVRHAFASRRIHVRRPRHLHIFDMDGTLLRDTTASLQIAQAHGHTQELVELELAYGAGEIDEVGFARRTWALFSHLTPSQVREVFDEAPWIRGMAQIVSDLHDLGEACIVITMSPNYFADYLLDFGFDVVIASDHPPLQGKAEDDMADTSGVLLAGDKVAIAEDWANYFGLSPDNCTAYGDSSSDVPLFMASGRTVAVNAGAELQAMAAVSYQGDDLRDAVAAGRSINTTAEHDSYQE